MDALVVFTFTETCFKFTLKPFSKVVASLKLMCPSKNFSYFAFTCVALELKDIRRKTVMFHKLSFFLKVYNVSSRRRKRVIHFKSNLFQLFDPWRYGDQNVTNVLGALSNIWPSGSSSSLFPIVGKQIKWTFVWKCTPLICREQSDAKSLTTKLEIFEA